MPAIEATIAVAAGLAACSIALIGFGADSLVEAMAGVVVLWRPAALLVAAVAVKEGRDPWRGEGCADGCC